VLQLSRICCFCFLQFEVSHVVTLPPPPPQSAPQPLHPTQPCNSQQPLSAPQRGSSVLSCTSQPQSHTPRAPSLCARSSRVRTLTLITCTIMQASRGTPTHTHTHVQVQMQINAKHLHWVRSYLVIDLASCANTRWRHGHMSAWRAWMVCEQLPTNHHHQASSRAPAIPCSTTPANWRTAMIAQKKKSGHRLAQATWPGHVILGVPEMTCPQASFGWAVQCQSYWRTVQLAALLLVKKPPFPYCSIWSICTVIGLDTRAWTV